MAFEIAPGLLSARFSPEDQADPGGDMRNFKPRKLPFMALLLTVAVVIKAGASKDHDLVSLVPPDVQIEAGMNAMTPGMQQDSFLLITPNNMVDLEDVLALSGADDARVIEQVVFVAGDL